MTTQDTPLTDAEYAMGYFDLDNYVDMTNLARRLERSHARLVEFIKGWSHDGHLQTFEDRERFRKEARAALEEAGKVATSIDTGEK